MTPARRNGLAVLIVLLLGAGVVAAFTVDEDGGTETATHATTTVPAPVSASTTTAPAQQATSTTTTTAGRPTTTTTAVPGGTSTTTAPATTAPTSTTVPTHPNTGGPSTLAPGLVLMAVGLAGLARRRAPSPRPR